jgi:hypothetical protein
MAFVAIYTVGRLKHPYEHPASREFFEVGYDVIRQAAKSGHLIEEFSLMECHSLRKLSKGRVFLFLH